jgi:hypothetical protein
MNERWTKYLELMGIGWYVAISIVLGLGGGLWLDGILGTSPAFTLIGLTVGLVIALYGAYRMVIAATSK